jgi:peptide/nickel transport system substrate-binding protein
LIQHIRWQAIIAFLGTILIVAILGYLSFNFTTVIVPDVGGTYVEGLAGNAQYINPILCQYNDVDRDLCALIFNGLTDANERGEIVPDLATRWEVSDDGLTYTFHLRRDVRWHDGAPFTADDIVFTIKTIQNPGFQGVPYLADLWRTVSVRRIDNYTVSFTLQEPFAPFIDYTTIGILPAHLLQNIEAKALPQARFNSQPVGTGLFQVEELSAKHIVLRANPHFHGARPYLSTIEFRFYPDYESIFGAYERGEIEGISRVLPEDLPKARGHRNLNLFSARLSGYTLIFLNLNNPNTPFFQSKEVRQALLYALDRQKIIDQILDGQGLVVHSPIMPNSWAYDQNIKKYGYDPDQAKALLDQAGWVDSDGDGIREKEGIKLEFGLLTNDDPTRVKIIEEIARQWAAVGVKAGPQTSGVSGLVRDFLVPRRYDAILTQWQELPPDPDPYPLWHSTQGQGEGQNYTGFAHREADQIMEEARRITDQTRRMELYHRFQQIFADEVPALLLYHPVYSYAIDKRVRGVQIAPMIEPSDRFRTLTDWYVLTRRVILSEAQKRQ